MKENKIASEIVAVSCGPAKSEVMFFNLLNVPWYLSHVCSLGAEFSPRNMPHDIKHSDYFGMCAGGKVNMLPCVYYSIEQAPETCSGSVLPRVYIPVFIHALLEFFFISIFCCGSFYFCLDIFKGILTFEYEKSNSISNSISNSWCCFKEIEHRCYGLLWITLGFDYCW